MKVPSSGTDFRPETEKPISLIGLLFFFFGAVHLYSFFRQQKSRETNQATPVLPQWLTTSLLATAMLGLVEILVS